VAGGRCRNWKNHFPLSSLDYQIIPGVNNGKETQENESVEGGFEEKECEKFVEKIER
jgi:hypothetical protein